MIGLRVRKLVLLAAVLLAAAALSTAMAGVASADEPQPFSWRIGEVSSSTTKAGTSPEVKIVLETSADTNEQGLESVRIGWPDGLVPTAGDDEYCMLEQDPADETYYCSNPNAKKIGSQSVSYALTSVLHDIFHVLEFEWLRDDGTLEMSTYLETPGPGEAARLVSIPEEDSVPAGYESLATALVSSAVLRSDGSGIDMTMEELPHALPVQVIDINPFHHLHPTLHINRIEMTVQGGQVSGLGEPLLTIPAICEPVYFETDFDSYGEDGFTESGDEVTVTDSEPFPITGCENVPYRPSVSFSLTSSLVGATSNLVTSTSIPSGDAQTKELRLSLPPGFALTPKEGARACTDAEVSSFSCTSSSAMGSFSASSALTKEPLEGTIYQAENQGNSVGIAVLVESDLGDINLSGWLSQTADGGMEMVFPDVPPLGMDNISINLDTPGGGSLQNPFACGSYLASSTATSHSNKQVTTTHPLTITGCKEPDSETALSVKLWKKISNRYTDVRFDITQYPSEQMKKATFYLPKTLVVRRRQPKGRPLAYVEFWSTDKVKRGTLYVSKKTKRSLYLKPRNRQLKGLKVRIYKSKGKKSKGKKSKGKKSKGKKSKAKTRISIQNIPEGTDISDFSLRLFGKRTRLVRTFKRCVRHKNLSFKVKTTNDKGTSRKAQDKLKVRCKRSKLHKKAKRKKANSKSR